MSEEARVLIFTVASNFQSGFSKALTSFLVSICQASAGLAIVLDWVWARQLSVGWSLMLTEHGIRCGHLPLTVCPRCVLGHPDSKHCSLLFPLKPESSGVSSSSWILNAAYLWKRTQDNLCQMMCSKF